jgi:transcriptional regulator with XRE-family HTH domain
MTENERLKIIRSHLGLTQRAFSEGLDIKQGSYSDVERGKAGVSAVLLKSLIRKFRVNPLWLCEGEGTMFIESDAELTLPNIASTMPTNENGATKSPEKDGQINLLEREQQYIESIKGLLEFLNE